MGNQRFEKDVTMPSVWQARKRISNIVSETPLISSPKLGELLGASVHLKLENMHEIGAFKIRGAANKLLSLTMEERAKGVTTFSTGNHGLAVAYVANTLGVKALICISNRVPQAKVDKLQQLGAEVIKVGDSQDEAEQYSYKLEKEHGLTVIKPFDDPFVIAGQGTIGLELLHHLPHIDTAIIPVSGGGLFAGIAFVLKKNNPKIKLIGVSMERSPVMFESVRANKPVSLKEQDTLADSLLGGIGLDNQYTFPMVQHLIDEFVLLSEEEIAKGMAFMLHEHRFIVEGAAATGVGAIVSGKIKEAGKEVATIITGNNVDPSVMKKII
ncbi:hydroxyectoine utilization dehydratase EutB [Pseudogracilibacillus auburnensis]|uniref:threonine ammonia-lyase n=1 Tax=Pseudogracilibacillus auburnensis TaxID=1494959 RepID=A0A2V3W2X8_9BACI|nr:hydroxyectoine utilization dehydratase EutB [Pseudogracilibacillus auburnensis]MBO1002108.1 hydroxyectoine utilization dehydratase EutB [Pseudogracilibacillus auburnensis]PXW87431.1 threonine dehydratase [Pseudogracilibacillus auburnensis]